MENLYPETPNPTTELIIDLPIRAFLGETARWGKFIAILGFVASGFMALVAIIFLLVPSMSQNSQFPVAGFIIGPIYLVMAIMYFFPSRFLYKFSSNIKAALFTNNQSALSTGFENLKSNFKFWGILLIVMLGFYAICIIGAIGFGILGSLLS
ncbi:hypothetical protein GZH53_13995 [Flavihumibacter sp. R14]|nr:hypothetical protein [Flavihumibacter soli]